MTIAIANEAAVYRIGDQVVTAEVYRDVLATRANSFRERIARKVLETVDFDQVAIAISAIASIR